MFQLAPPETPTQWEQYFELRWRILRDPWQQPRGSERDELDEPGNAVNHVAAWSVEVRILGVGRLHLKDSSAAQIRFMAVEPEYRGHGIGRAIVSYLEAAAQARQIERIVLNAREEVVDFYRRLGYDVVGPGPVMFGEVKHSCMERQLSATPRK